MLRHLRWMIGLLIMGLFSNAHGQNLWTHADGGLSNDEAMDVANSSANNVVTVGYVGTGASIDGVPSPNYGISDIFVSRRLSGGSLAWAKYFGGSGPDRALAVCSDSYGNSYVTGFFSNTAQFGDISLTAIGNSQDIFVCKISVSGQVLWAFRAGGDGDDIGYGIDIDNNGSVYVVGQYSGTGDFGVFNVASMNYSGNTGASQDLFVCRLNSNGQIVWVKTGEAPNDDRALDVTVTSDNKVYVCGYFTDNLQMDQLYVNAVDNIGFVLQLDVLGNELNMTYYTSVYLMLEDIESAADGSYFLLGTYQGQLAAPASFNGLYSSAYENSIFILRAQPDGTILWFEDLGSENALNGRAMDLDTEGNAYISATFACDLTELNQEWGGSLYHSAGYNDVIVAKYSGSGVREWVVQYGGGGDTQTQGLAVLADDWFVIAGGFSNRICAPDPDGLVSSPGSWSSGNLEHIDNHNMIACGGLQGDYVCVVSAGNRDIFTFSPFHAGYPLYNYQDQPTMNGCNDVVPPVCFEECQDTVYQCLEMGESPHPLSLECFTEELNWYGPYYDLEFSPNVTSYFLDPVVGEWKVYITVSGWYVATLYRQDGCGEPMVDSIYVQIHHIPPNPIFSSEFGTIEEGFIGAVSLDLCLDYDILNVDYSSNYTDAYWLVNGDTLYDNPLQIDTSGIYTFHAIYTEECGALSEFNYEFHDYVPPAAQDAELLLSLQGGIVTEDTVWLCSGENILFAYTFNNPLPESDANDLMMYWILDNANPDSSDHFEESLTYLQTGWHTLQVWVNYQGNGCDYEVIERTFYVNSYPSVNPWITAPDLIYICPGEQIEFDWSYGPDGVTIDEVQYATMVDDNTVMINGPNDVVLRVSIVTEDGCVFFESESVVVSYYPTPVATSDPENAVICPGAAVGLSVTPGASYLWIGPEGNALSTDQTYEPDVPGEYFCIMTNEQGCSLESNFIYVSEYSTPYLASSPWTYFCIQDTIFLDVVTNEQSSISWLPPLSGNALQQFVFEPGTYGVVTSLCGITDSLFIEIGDSPVDTTMTVEAPEFFCQGDSILLIGLNNGNLYYWNNALIPSDTMVVTAPGVYEAFVVDWNGCEAYSTQFNIDFYQPPMLSTSGYYACPDSTFLLQSPGDWQTVWMDENFNWLSNQSEWLTAPVTDTLYYYTYLTQDECVTDTLLIPVMPYQMNTLEWTNVLLCEDELIQFDLQFLPNTQVVWDFGVDEIYGIDEPNYLFAHPGDYPIELSLINPFGCPQYLSDTLTVLTKPMGGFEVESDAFCSPESLIANNSSLLFESTEWSFGSWVWTSQSLDQSIVHLGCDPWIEDLQMIVTASSGCQDTIVRTITVWPQPIPSLTFDTPVTCFPDLSVDVNDTTPCSDQSLWFVDGALQQVGPSVELIDQEGDGLWIELLSINSYGCSNSLDSTYFLTDPPSLDFQVSTWAGCEDLAIHMEALNSAMDSVLWFIGDEWSDHGAQSDVTLTEPGIYDFSLIAANDVGCADTLFLSDAIEVFPTPIVDFAVIPDPGTMFDATFKFVEACDEPMYSYTWDMAGVATLFGDSVTYNFGEWLNFDVQLTAVSAHGCSATAIQSVMVSTQAYCFVPNSFTPNGDGVNDAFIPRFSVPDDVLSYHFEIRDRWGILVFQTQEIHEAWQGQFRDGVHLVANDSYIWTMDYTVLGEKDAIHSSGIVILIR